MGKPWHRLNPAQFEEERRQVEREYQDLHFQVAPESVRLCGKFPVIYEGEVLDRFLIEIQIARNHPYTLPIVRETGGRIPNAPDRHVNRDGSACILLPDERWRIWPTTSTILEFLNGPVRNYFIAQALVERGDPWPFKEWAHGATGVLEYYSELLETEDIEVIKGYLACLAAKKLKGHWLCPCGSLRRIRECHIDFLCDLRTKISQEHAARSVATLRLT